ncbi:MAG: Crp/Fnr family transcriptional regulator [Bacteroidia bacterium]
MIDLEKIKLIYNIGRGLRMEDVQILFKAASSRTYQPGDYLIREGSEVPEVFYVRKGLVRVFIINEKGEEITTQLLPEHHVVASHDVILFDQPSRFFFEAFEETKTFSMDYDMLQTVISRNKKLDENRKFILQKLLKISLSRVESFVLYSPEERYERFVEANPDLINRVPGKYIANVLGITPVSLSRIRSRIAVRMKNEEIKE